MTTLTPIPAGFELDNPTLEERLLNLERVLGYAPDVGNPCGTQSPLPDQVEFLRRRVRALEDLAGVKRKAPFINPFGLGAPPVEP